MCWNSHICRKCHIRYSLFRFHLVAYMYLSTSTYYFFSSFLTQCRPLSVSMGNAIKYVKFHISQIPQDMPDSEVLLSGSLCAWAWSMRNDVALVVTLSLIGRAHPCTLNRYHGDNELVNTAIWLTPCPMGNEALFWMCNFQIHCSDFLHEQLPLDELHRILLMINIGSGNGLVPSGTKPLPEPVLAQIYLAIWY